MPPPEIGTPLKILLVGESSVGKSSIVQSFTSHTFQENICASMGMDYSSKMMEVNGRQFNLSLWDTAGQERFMAMTANFFRNAHGAVVVYDVTDKNSLGKMNRWMDEVKRNATNEDIALLLLGNKIDMKRTVSEAMGRAVATENNMLYHESSAKTHTGITEAFTSLVQKILDTPGLCDGPAPNIRLNKEKPQNEPNTGCINCYNNSFFFSNR